jgi:hypothetical protein
MSWQLKGTYIESCSCDVACPCVFLSAPTQGECNALVAWHIDQGRHDQVKLDGLNIALAIHAPGHMAQTKWNAAVYVDDRATPEQETALVTIFGGQAGGHPAALASFVGNILGVKKVPVAFTQAGKNFTVQIANIAELTTEPIAGAGGADVQISGHPLCVAPGFAVTVSRSNNLKYTDHGMSWDLTQKNAFFSPFEYRA